MLHISRGKGVLAGFLSQWQLQGMALLGVLFLLTFNYAPLFGLVVSFIDADYSINLLASIKKFDWVGFEFFKEFFSDEQFMDIVKNTLGLNMIQLLVNFPAPIIFAILLNEIVHRKFKRFVQTITYFPYFISWIVFGGIVINMLSVDLGVLNPILIKLGMIQEPIPFLAYPQYFWWIIVITSLIKGIGWGAIIYLAAITSIDPALVEAATIDGAGRFRRIIHVTLPAISGTILIFFLLTIGNLMTSSFDQIYIFQSPVNLEASEVLDTFVYKVGITQMRYSYTAAVGLFKSFASMLLLVTGHVICKKTIGRGLY